MEEMEKSVLISENSECIEMWPLLMKNHLHYSSVFQNYKQNSIFNRKIILKSQ